MSLGRAVSNDGRQRHAIQHEPPTSSIEIAAKTKNSTIRVTTEVENTSPAESVSNHSLDVQRRRQREERDHDHRDDDQRRDQRSAPSRAPPQRQRRRVRAAHRRPRGRV